MEVARELVFARKNTGWRRLTLALAPRIVGILSPVRHATVTWPVQVGGMNEPVSFLGTTDSSPGFPEDLAESTGAVRLMHSVLDAVASVGAPLLPFGRTGGPSAGVPVLVTLYTLALARGWYCADEIAARMESDGCLRYLGRGVQPDAGMLRSFRRRHGGILARALSRVVENLGAGKETPDTAACFVEAGRRLQAAIEADSYALDL